MSDIDEPKLSQEFVQVKIECDSPAQDIDSPAQDIEGQSQDIESPTQDIEGPLQDIESPSRDIESPSRDIESPSRDIESPSQDIESPSRDIESPSQDIGDPPQDVESPSRDVESPPHDTDAITPEANDAEKEDPKNENVEKNFPSIEGELLDFEDFNEKLADAEQANDAKNNTESEDGQCDTPEKKSPEEKDDEPPEEGEDEGVCSGEEDLEEGEISSEKKDNSQPAVCRFFHRGMCYYGSACRFLHPNDKKGNYSMFDTAPRLYTDSYARMGQAMNHRRQVPFLPTPPPPAYEIETAWERGLKEAKVLLKQANKRKDEPDFEEKRLNMGLGSKQHLELEKETDTSPKRERRKNNEGRQRYEDITDYNNDFEVYSKEPYMPVHEDEKDTRGPSRFRKSSYDRFSRSPRHRWNCSRFDDSKMQRPDQAHKYFDPWQRSRSPIRNRTSRSVSCSPVSSYSCSSRSSRSYSRSSSRSSYCSSRKSSSSRSRSRTRSRSISMDSVSSASSRNSSGSHSSGPPKQGSAHRKARPVAGRSEATSAPYPKSPPPVKVKVSSLSDKRDALEENFHKPLDISAIPSFQHLVPDIPERNREPVRGLHKQSIKLTLLNKNLQPKVHSLPKKDPHTTKKPEAVTKTDVQQGVKRPLSPTSASKPAAPAAKRSASSRRDDLLKQLKAVEDAIARKRAK